MVINNNKLEGTTMHGALKSTILDILSDLTEIESKKKLVNLLNTTKPHKTDHHTSVIYRLRGGERRKIDIGYYNSSLCGDFIQPIFIWNSQFILVTLIESIIYQISKILYFPTIT